MLWQEECSSGEYGGALFLNLNPLAGETEGSRYLSHVTFSSCEPLSIPSLQALASACLVHS